MKLTSYFSVFKKMLLAGAILLCASELSLGRSILDQERSEDFLRAEVFGPNDFLKGALTFDYFYSFDYAHAGIGTVTFRPGSKKFQPFVIDRESPRAVGSWASESNSFLSSSFPTFSSGFVRGDSMAAFDDQTEPTSPDNFTAAPEPSTWITGALALLAMGFARRRWLRRLIANRT